MNHDKLRQYSHVSAVIGSGIASLLKAQDLLIDLMYKECDIPESIKKTMADDMNGIIGIKKL